ncbi:three-Cys-motif partner protein TcmP [Steroidobacter cummioxidans]|uniref:three-Cys-motif partner protein TcmP n=1 Tax=Steroidobacter cummioxidans TaxID=1803913 RepID=UPI000E30B680|nr:three-Cys-motif partner protein TcmP [Steroidobacter cummioxidans]
MDRSKLESYSGREQASVKHHLLESYFKRLIMITAQGRYNRIAYVDAFAGPWQSSRDDLSDTSFARAVEVMESCRAELERVFRRSVSFRALFVERNPTSYARLQTFAQQRSTTQLQITAINEDFAESAESVAAWIRDEEMAFVLVDPTGWKDVVFPATLAPLLRKPNVEMLINFMWNFISLAAGHANQLKNLQSTFGDEYQSIVKDGAKSGLLMPTYLRRLRETAGRTNSRSRLRAAYFPVEFPNKKRVYYYLTYVTHHYKGMIVFLEESEKAFKYQDEVKFIVKQQRREVASGMTDIFGDDLGDQTDEKFRPMTDARSLWLEALPKAGAELLVDEEKIANMAEKGNCLISSLQDALRDLISDRTMQNLSSAKLRPKNVVDFKKGETIRRFV